MHNDARKCHDLELWVRDAQSKPLKEVTAPVPLQSNDCCLL